MRAGAWRKLGGVLLGAGLHRRADAPVPGHGSLGRRSRRPPRAGRGRAAHPRVATVARRRRGRGTGRDPDAKSSPACSGSRGSSTTTDHAPASTPTHAMQRMHSPLEPLTLAPGRYLLLIPQTNSLKVSDPRDLLLIADTNIQQANRCDSGRIEGIGPRAMRFTNGRQVDPDGAPGRHAGAPGLVAREPAQRLRPLARTRWSLLQPESLERVAVEPRVRAQRDRQPEMGPGLSPTAEPLEALPERVMRVVARTGRARGRARTWPAPARAARS